MYRGIQDALGAPARLCHRNSESRTPVAKRISGGGEPDAERSDQGSAVTLRRRESHLGGHSCLALRLRFCIPLISPGRKAGPVGWRVASRLFAEVNLSSPSSPPPPSSRIRTQWKCRFPSLRTRKH